MKTHPPLLPRALGAFSPLLNSTSGAAAVWIRSAARERFTGLMALTFCLALLAPTTSQAQLAFSPVVTPYSGTGQVKAASGNGYMFAPGAVSFEAPDGSGGILKKVLLNWGFNVDVPGGGGLETIFNRAISTNGGKTFGATITTDPYIPSGMAFKKRDGSMVYPTWYPVYPAVLPNTVFGPFDYLTSTDHGDTWVTQSGGTYNFSPLSVNGVRFNGIYIETSSALYGTAYVAVSGDGAGIWRAIAMKSTNGGTNWTYVGTIAGTGTSNYDESSIVVSKDGTKWIGMVRQGNYKPIHYVTSTNQGVTWTSPVIPSGFGTNTSATNRVDHQNDSINPRLLMLPNGVLAASFGRPHSRFALSLDGNGTSWSNMTITILEELPDPYPDTLGAHTSGNTTPVNITGNRFMVFGDTGANWSYHTASGAIIDHPSPNPFSIRAHFVDVVLANKINRVDLKNRYLADTTTVATDMTYTPNATMIPESRASGAFDGSIRYRSGAFKNATTGTFTIDLKKNFVINGLGICLFYDTTESATIDVAQNSGGPWTTIKTYVSAKHYAMDYPTITPITGRYVRVSVSSAGPLVCLNEIELYTTSDSFEHNTVTVDSNPHGVVPPGYVTSGTTSTQYGFAVREAPTKPGYQSDRSLEMYDGSSGWIAGIKKSVAQTTSKSWEFRYKPVAYESTGVNGHTFQILGNVTGVGTSAAVYYFAMMPNGRVQYYNGATWVDVVGAPAGTIPFNTWSLIRVDVTLPGNAALFVNGVAKGTFPMYRVPANVLGLNGFNLGSSGTGLFGDRALYDDLTIN